MTDQYTFQNPVTAYEHIEPPKQHQPEPGLDAKLIPKADLGEDTYRGTGRLDGRKAIVTGADSGIGAATAIAFAREGADVVLSYLPEEEEDATRIANLIEKAGRKAVKVAVPVALGAGMLAGVVLSGAAVARRRRNRPLS